VMKGERRKPKRTPEKICCRGEEDPSEVFDGSLGEDLQTSDRGRSHGPSIFRTYLRGSITDQNP